MTDDKEFEETLGVVKIDGNAAWAETQKTLPFLMALHILLDTEEGQILEKKRSMREITAKEFEEGIRSLGIKYRHLILA